jgi:hypothetical protein
MTAREVGIKIGDKIRLVVEKDYVIEVIEIWDKKEINNKEYFKTSSGNLFLDDNYAKITTLNRKIEKKLKISDLI